MRWVFNFCRAFLGFCILFLILVIVSIVFMVWVTAIAFMFFGAIFGFLGFIILFCVTCGPFFLASIIELPFALIRKAPLYSCLLGKKVLFVWGLIWDKSEIVAEFCFGTVMGGFIEKVLEISEIMYCYVDKVCGIESFMNTTLDGINTVCKGSYSKG